MTTVRAQYHLRQSPQGLLAWDVRLFGIPVFPMLGGLGVAASLAVLALTMRRQKALE